MSNKVSALAIKEHTFGSALSSTNTWCTNQKHESVWKSGNGELIYLIKHTTFEIQTCWIPNSHIFIVHPVEEKENESNWKNS